MSDLPRNPRYESLDVWRGIACLTVTMLHGVAGYLSTPELETRVRAEGGSVADWLMVLGTRLWFGVPLFFVISGYCIAGAADSARRKPHPGLTFFWRRFRRIYPPLWAFLAITAVVVALLPDAAIPGPNEEHARPLPRPTELKPAQWFGSLTLTEEWRPYIGGPSKDYFARQVWTLCYEEQFYFVMGLIVLLARQWLFPLAAAISAIVFLNVMDLNTLLGDQIGVNLNAYQRPLRGCFFDGLWLAFAAGISVYYRVNYATPLIRWSLDGLLVAGLFSTIQALPTAWDFQSNLTGHLIVAFAGALLLGWLHGADTKIATSRFTAPLRWAGRMCYSLYLVHGPVTALIQWNFYRWGITSPTAGLLITLPVATAASLALSWVFHRTVESRFLNTPPKPIAPAADH
ncbi:MAG: acyltransferase [Planctomycetes bacterium]|nr:acyltransferase [Planctomycetota bacterium]